MSRRTIVSSLAVALLAVAGCESPTDPSETLPVTRVTQGAFSAAETRQRLVVRSQQDLAAAWMAMFRTFSEPPPVPVVDFSQEMVIIALAGSKPSGGYCIVVERAAGNRRSAAITVRSIGPTPTSALLPVITNPYDVVRVPRRDTVTFSEMSEIGNCGPLT
jgi:hypothetical protein